MLFYRALPFGRACFHVFLDVKGLKTLKYNIGDMDNTAGKREVIMADWVIIVDDDTANLNTAKHALTKHGIEVTTLRSGSALLDFLRENEAPGLILLDLLTNGFDTLKKIRKLEKDGRETPVIFLSSDENQESEARGLRLGAMDFIRKPFDPDALVRRVMNTLRTQEKIHQFEKDVIMDQMTGLLNKNTVEERITIECRRGAGFLCMMDLDSFKLINDLYGHDAGDRALILFSDLLRSNLRAEDICGRIGGDEFVLFMKNMNNEEGLRKFCERINQQYLRMMEGELGAPLKIPLGVSIGAAEVPAHGREYDRLFHLADQALLTVKLTGKHQCAVTGGARENLQDESGTMNLESVTKIMEERSVSTNAMWMGKEAFINIYRYMMRYMERYHGVAYRVLFTLTMASGEYNREEQDEIRDRFRGLVQSSLRNSDVMVEVSEDQIFLLLPGILEDNIHVVTDRMTARWRREGMQQKASITWEAGKVMLGEDEEEEIERGKDRIAVICADNQELGRIGTILEDEGMRVTAISSGLELPDRLRDEDPDLILMDEEMAETEGFESFREIKRFVWNGREIPVILLTDGKKEALALERGAEETVCRPYAPEILVHRVRRTIELGRLRGVVEEAGRRRG